MTPPTVCAQQDCRRKTSILFFECRFCKAKFCSAHQLPESHACDIKSSDAYEKYRATCECARPPLLTPAENGRLARL